MDANVIDDDCLYDLYCQACDETFSELKDEFEEYLRIENLKRCN